MFVHLHSSSESAAEGVEDAEAIIQLKGLVVFTEEVNQCVAGLPQLLPSVVQRTQGKVGGLREQSRSHFTQTKKRQELRTSLSF